MIAVSITSSEFSSNIFDSRLVRKVKYSFAEVIFVSCSMVFITLATAAVGSTNAELLEIEDTVGDMWAQCHKNIRNESDMVDLF